MSAYIGIHLLVTGRKLFYSHTDNPFPERELSSVEEEALTFAEGLGAMLDEVNLSKMSRDEKERWIDAQDIFTPALEKKDIPTAQPAAPVSPVQTAQATGAAPTPQQPPQSPQTSPVQEMQQPSLVQPVPSAPVVPQPAQAQPVQPGNAQQASPAPSAPAEQVQQRPAPQQIVPEQIVPQGQDAQSPAPEAKSQKRETQDVSSGTLAVERGREVREQAHARPTQAAPASKERLEIIQEAIKAGVVKPPKPSVKKDAQSATGVVSRDREALARLLASF
jgi:hypothetical protein